MNKETNAKFIVLLPPVIWGFLPMFMKIGYEYFDPFTMNFIRVLASFVFCLALTIYRGWLKAGTILSVLKKTVKVAFLFASFQILYALGVGLIPASLTGMIFGLFPVTMTIINLVKGDERISIKTSAGVILSFAGVVIIMAMSGGMESGADISLYGLMMIFLSQVSYALFTYESKRTVKDVNPIVVIMMSMIPSIFVFLMMSYSDVVSLDYSEVHLMGWVSVFFTGIFSMGIANALWMWCAGKLGSMRLSLYSNINPVVALISGIVFLNESFNTYQYLGVAMVFAAIAISQKPDKGARLDSITK